MDTVNSEIFARVLFSRNFVDAKFCEIKPSRNEEMTLSFTDVGKSCPSLEFFNVGNISFNVIHENKILAKISEFTMSLVYCPAV